MAARKPVERLTFLVGAPPPPASGPAHARPAAPPPPGPLSQIDVSPALLRRAQGPAARRIESEEDVADVIALLRLNYNRQIARHGLPAAG